MSTDDNTCANCGKGEESSGDLKACTACKMVKYCNRDCQIAHRPQHRKACKKRAAELRDKKLFEETPPPPKDCPICMLPLPHESATATFFSCCGKNVCNGCICAMAESGAKRLCPFCRMPPSRSDEDEVNRVKQLMDKSNASAYYQLGGYYSHGTDGMPQDWEKANELYLKGGELGHAGAYLNLGVAYEQGKGVEMNMKKAKHYYELAAMNGDIHARNNLGNVEGRDGNNHRAFKHFIIAARAGSKRSLDTVKEGYKGGHVTKDEYANTLREYQKSQDEVTSDARDTTVRDD